MQVWKAVSGVASIGQSDGSQFEDEVTGATVVFLTLFPSLALACSDKGRSHASVSSAVERPWGPMELRDDSASQALKALVRQL